MDHQAGDPTKPDLQGHEAIEFAKFEKLLAKVATKKLVNPFGSSFGEKIQIELLQGELGKKYAPIMPENISHLSLYGALIEIQTEEIKKELNAASAELNLKNAELAKKEKELGDKNAEIGKRTNELEDVQTKLGNKKSELNSITNQLEGKTQEINLEETEARVIYLRAFREFEDSLPDLEKKSDASDALRVASQIYIQGKGVWNMYSIGYMTNEPGFRGKSNVPENLKTAFDKAQRIMQKLQPPDIAISKRRDSVAKLKQVFSALYEEINNFPKSWEPERVGDFWGPKL
jgi:hypothetical protein